MGTAGLLITTPLYFDWQDLGKNEAAKVYLAGAARLAATLPPQTLVVHYLPYPPHNFHHFCQLRFKAWLSVPARYPADAYFVVDADMHPYPTLYPALQEIFQEADGVLIGYDLPLFAKANAGRAPTLWGWKWLYRTFGIRYQWHVGGGCWGAKRDLWLKVVTIAKDLYDKYAEMGGDKINAYEWATSVGSLNEEHAISAACALVNDAKWITLPFWERHHLDRQRVVTYKDKPLLQIFNTHGDWERKQTIRLLGEWFHEPPERLWDLIQSRQIIMEGE